MYAQLAIISTQRIKATMNYTYSNKGKYVLQLIYQSQSDKERFCRHYTVKREHALPANKNHGNHVVFQVTLNFLLFCLIS